MEKIIQVCMIIALCWGIWAVKTLFECKKNNIPLKSKLNELWNNRFWIGPEKLTVFREAIAICIFSLIIIYNFLHTNTDVTYYLNCHDLTAFIILLIYTFIFGKFSLKQYIVLGLIESIIFTDIFIIENNYYKNFLGIYLELILIIIIAYNIGVQKIVKVYFTLYSVLYSIALILSSSGIIKTYDMTVMETRGKTDGWLSVRYAFGLEHPNTAGLILAIWVILWFSVRYSKIKWIDWIIGLSALGVITFVNDSRSASIFLFIFLILIFIDKYFPKMYSILYDIKIIKYLFLTTPVICAGTSVFAAYNYNPDNALWNKLDSLLTGRISLMSKALKEIHFSLFGKLTNQSIKPDFFVDDFYTYYFLCYGVISLLILIIAFVLLLNKLTKMKANPEIALAFSYIIYFCVENAFLKPYKNIMLLLFVCAFTAGNRMFMPSGEKNPTNNKQLNKKIQQIINN